MVVREICNFVTGGVAFICWYRLTEKHPEHSLKIAVSCLSMLLGFAGRETLCEIIKILKVPI